MICGSNQQFISISVSHTPPFITLKFIQLSTECVYDYIFVYDGSSSTNSTLLGSFSGRDSIPNRMLIAESGSMLIVLFRYFILYQKGNIRPNQIDFHKIC